MFFFIEMIIWASEQNAFWVKEEEAVRTNDLETGDKRRRFRTIVVCGKRLIIEPANANDDLYLHTLMLITPHGRGQVFSLIKTKLSKSEVHESQEGHRRPLADVIGTEAGLMFTSRDYLGVI